MTDRQWDGQTDREAESTRERERHREIHGDREREREMYLLTSVVTALDSASAQVLSHGFRVVGVPCWTNFVFGVSAVP